MFIDNWYKKSTRWSLLLLLPIEWLFRLLCIIVRNRRSQLQWIASCPVIIVGNISIGGTGKSPLTIALIDILRERGYKVAVVSRGYGAKRTEFPHWVKSTDLADSSGDEPLMIVQQSGVDLVIDPNRVRGCQYLLQHTDCDVIISDDGLQHYQLGRDIEIAVIDGTRGLGNGHCLPVGPLREPESRLQSVDFVVVNGQSQQSYPHASTMNIEAAAWYRVSDEQCVSLQDFASIVMQGQVHAIAGIGHPQRFYDSLAQMGLSVSAHDFADHHQYVPADFAFMSQSPQSVLCMTHKDAVKCKNIAPQNSYYLKITATLEPEFINQLCAKIQASIVNKSKSLARD